MKKVQVRVTIDPDLLAWLQAEADRRRVSMSFIIREWIIREQEARKS